METEDYETVAQLIGRMGVVWFWAGMPAELKHWAEATVADDLSDSARGMVTFQLAWSEAYLGNPVKALSNMDDAVGLLDGRTEPWFFGYILGSRAVMSILGGDPDGAETYASNALEAGIKAGHPFVTGNARAVHWLAALLRGADEEAMSREADFRASLPNIDAMHAVTCFFRAALILATRGDFAQAIRHAREAIELARESGDVYHASVSLGVLACSMGDGKYSHACTILAAAHSTAESVGLDPYALLPPALYRELLERLRSNLTEDEFEDAWQRGLDMTRNDALAFALSPEAR